MGESSLSLDYAAIRVHLGRILGWDRDPANWTADQITDGDDFIAEGLRRFYAEHDWTFLKPRYEFDLEAGKYKYELPADFGGMIGPLAHADQETLYAPLTKISVAQLDAKRQSIANTSWPQYYAENPLRNLGQAGQRWELLVWPTPDATYPVVGRYEVLKDTIDGTDNTYPAGGARHAETIKSAVAAAAEATLRDQQGVHENLYQKHLARSIENDARAHSADSLGVDAASYRRDDVGEIDVRGWGGVVTYAGITPEGG